MDPRQQETKTDNFRLARDTSEVANGKQKKARKRWQGVARLLRELRLWDHRGKADRQAKDKRTRVLVLGFEWKPVGYEIVPSSKAAPPPNCLEYPTGGVSRPTTFQRVAA